MNYSSILLISILKERYYNIHTICKYIYLSISCNLISIYISFSRKNDYLPTNLICVKKTRLTTYIIAKPNKSDDMTDKLDFKVTSLSKCTQILQEPPFKLGLNYIG